MNTDIESSASETSTVECYRQVWRAWSRWPVFRVAVWIMILQWAMSLAYQYFRPLEVQERALSSDHYYELWLLLFIGSSMLQVILTVAVPLMIVGHVKTQMASWRSSLMPDFRRPHLMVAALISVVIFVVMACAPAALQLVREYGDAGAVYNSSKRLDPQSSFGTPYTSYIDVNSQFEYSVVSPALFSLAEVVFIFGFTGLVASRFSAWAALAFLLIVAFGSDRLNHGYYRAGTWQIPDQDPLVIACLSLVDIVLLIGLWKRLGRITAERDSLPTDERLPWLSNLLAGRESERTGGLVDAGLWRRVRHRRRLGLGHRFIWITAVFLVFLVGVQIWIDPIDPTGIAFAAVFAPGVVSALAIGLSWPLRFAALGEVEMLRPARRVAFAREMGLAMLLDALEIYLATMLAVLVPLYFWAPEALSNPAFLPALAAAILAQILIFGAIVWCIRLRSWAVSMGLSVLAVLAISVLVTQAMADRQYAVPVAGAAVGIALTADAYRRWLKMDML